MRTARGAGLTRQVGRYLQELETLDEIELFRVWMEDLPTQGESQEGPANDRANSRSGGHRLDDRGQ